jgi:hypothetical protein
VVGVVDRSPADGRQGGVVSAIATAIIPIATSTGEGEHNLPRTALLVAHTEIGDELLPFTGAR